MVLGAAQSKACCSQQGALGGSSNRSASKPLLRSEPRGARVLTQTSLIEINELE